MKKNKNILCGVTLSLTLACSTMLLGVPNSSTLNECTIKILAKDKPVKAEAIQMEILAPHVFYVNEQAMDANEQIINYNGRIYVPLRSVSKILGAEVDYIVDQKVAIITTSDTKIEIPIGYNQGAIIKEDANVIVTLLDQNNKESVSVIHNNKAYVPIRFVAENLGYTVNYIQGKNQIKLSESEGESNTLSNNSSKDKNIERGGENEGNKLDTRVEVKNDGTSDFKYIKPSTDEDVESQAIITDNGALAEIKYIKNQIIFLAKKDATFEELKEMIGKHDGIIVGYVARTRRYQVEFFECTYDDLQSKIKILAEEKLLQTKSIQLNYVVEETTN